MEANRRMFPKRTREKLNFRGRTERRVQSIRAVKCRKVCVPLLEVRNWGQNTTQPVRIKGKLPIDVKLLEDTLQQNYHKGAIESLFSLRNLIQFNNQNRQTNIIMIHIV